MCDHVSPISARRFRNKIAVGEGSLCIVDAIFMTLVGVIQIHKAGVCICGSLVLVLEIYTNLWCWFAECCWLLWDGLHGMQMLCHAT